MRTVLKNSAEVAHYWANKIQFHGRNSGDTIHFNGIHLYSYNTEIACFRVLPDGRDCVFICNHTYSNTTTGHQSDARHASRHLTQFVYERATGTDSRSPFDVNPTDIWEEYRDNYLEQFESSLLPKYSRTKESRLNQAERWADEANRIAVAFNLTVEMLSIDVAPEVRAAMEAEAKEKLEQEKQIKKTRDLELKADRELWLRGERDTYPQYYDADIQLRVSPNNPEEVETSRRATVPLAVCRRLYQSWQRQQMPENTSVGVYKLNKVHPDGITIGCHEISKKEIERFAKVLWGEE